MNIVKRVIISIFSLTIIILSIMAAMVVFSMKNKPVTLTNQVVTNQPAMNEPINIVQTLNDQAQIIPPTKTDCADELDTTCWNTYKNAEYGYSITYPIFYEKDKSLYSIWTTSGGAVNLLEEWGVNKGQETIFVISVYPKDKESEVFQYYGHKILDETVMINGETANKLKGMGVYDDLIIENDNYFFIIHSSFSDLIGSSEYQEYKSILDNIKFLN